MNIILYWDFFGPDAEGTARHFRVHLDDFIARGALVGCETGIESAGPGHHAAWCKAPDAAREALMRLRPRRAAPLPA